LSPKEKDGRNALACGERGLDPHKWLEVVVFSTEVTVVALGDVSEK
jgi:hypothetical protein